VGEQLDHQAVGLAQHGAVGVGHGRRDERLATVETIDAAAADQRGVDRRDGTVVDV
jgi:hypothetical protein